MWDIGQLDTLLQSRYGVITKKILKRFIDVLGTNNFAFSYLDRFTVHAASCVRVTHFTRIRLVVKCKYLSRLLYETLKHLMFTVSLFFSLSSFFIFLTEPLMFSWNEINIEHLHYLFSFI